MKKVEKKVAAPVQKAAEETEAQGLSQDEAWMLKMPDHIMNKEHGDMQYSNLIQIPNKTNGKK